MQKVRYHSAPLDSLLGWSTVRRLLVSNIQGAPETRQGAKAQRDVLWAARRRQLN